ncbi:tetratricopeptide repeat protein [uncultured Maribacter sp.]|uniref:tetratricopeptide repeat protein n=1 Tax=uncultured Maribacter sp. TaxID=431308 RepID=UPI00263562C4|nr:tetratricopeptide repeat protein [uncultured Maribacter sp.]
MNVKDFTYFLEHPTKVVEPIHTKHLEDIIAEYPYFQAARALHLKGLKNLNSYKYNKALKVTAAYTTDRDVLFEFITSKDFLQYDGDIPEENIVASESKEEEIVHIEETDKISENEHIEIVKEIEEVTEIEAEIETEDSITEDEIVEIEKNDFSTKETAIASLITPSEDKPLPQDEHDADQILDPGLFQTKNPANTEEENALDIGKPLTFDAKEKYSFSEWLSLASKKPLEESKEDFTETQEEIIEQQPVARESNIKKTVQKVKEIKITQKPIRKPRANSEAIKKKYDRIDKFIASNPKIVPTEQSTVIDISKSSKIDHNELMTETLARVYLEQKKYKNAIQAYKILILKYPEKSSFFADRIKAVEKLRKDNK